MEIPPEVLQELRDDMREIKNAVIGNAEFGVTGLVKRTDVLEEKLRKLDIRLAKIIGGAGVLLYLIDRFFMP